MAIISTCAYDAQGQIVRPTTSAITRAKTQLFLDTGETPTFDRGYVHVFTVSASGDTPEATRRKASTKLARFFDRAEAVDGYRKIDVRKDQSRLSISYEILYAIEAYTRPESPVAGKMRGLLTRTTQ